MDSHSELRVASAPAMRLAANFLSVLLFALGLCSCDSHQKHLTANPPKAFAAHGVVKELKPDGRIVIVRHEAITNYMEAMTMPFRVRATNLLSGLHPGDEIDFRLQVTEDESWIDSITRTGHSPVPVTTDTSSSPGTNATITFNIANIPEFALTNEFGQSFSLRQLRGQAVALTFFFTRCPIPDYCPRLTKNFQAAVEKLKAAPAGPTNFHFLSISFDPLDSPLLLRAYAQRYRYDSNHWTFLTGHPDHIRELAGGFGLSFKPGAGIYTHDFRTAIFDATGALQTIWPIGGDLTDQLAVEITKAARIMETSSPGPR